MFFTEDSFGSRCPENWEEIADYLNNLNPQSKEEAEEIWEAYCSERLEGAPEPIFDD